MKFALTRLTTLETNISEEVSIAGDSFSRGGEVGLRCELFQGAQATEFRSATAGIAAVQLVESGRFFQRRWHKATVGRFSINQNETGLEIGTWPDRLSLVLRFATGATLTNPSLQMSLQL